MCPLRTAGKNGENMLDIIVYHVGQVSRIDNHPRILDDSGANKDTNAKEGNIVILRHIFNLVM